MFLLILKMFKTLSNTNCTFSTTIYIIRLYKRQEKGQTSRELLTTQQDHWGWVWELLTTQQDHRGWVWELLTTQDHRGWVWELLTTQQDHRG